MSTRTTARLGLCAALGGLLAASWLTLAPGARADASGFLDQVHGLGFYSKNGDGALLASGYGVCTMISRPGVTGYDAARVIYNNTGYDVTADDAANFVIAAVEQLCPQYDGRGRSSGVAA